MKPEYLSKMGSQNGIAQQIKTGKGENEKKDLKNAWQIKKTHLEKSR